MSDVKYDTFVNSLSELLEDQEIAITVRSLTPGTQKYTHRRLKARVSSSSERYPDGLAIRFGRGQLHGDRYSIQVLEELRSVPEKYE